jgi:hypothetical protein
LRKTAGTHLRAVYKNDYEVVRDMGNSVRTMIKAYAELLTPEGVSLEHWMITPGKIKEYRRSKAWKKVSRDAAEKLAAKIEAEAKAKKATASEATPKQKASETAKA